MKLENHLIKLIQCSKGGVFIGANPPDMKKDFPQIQFTELNSNIEYTNGAASETINFRVRIWHKWPPKCNHADQALETLKERLELSKHYLLALLPTFKKAFKYSLPQGQSTRIVKRSVETTENKLLVVELFAQVSTTTKIEYDFFDLNCLSSEEQIVKAGWGW